MQRLPDVSRQAGVKFVPRQKRLCAVLEHLEFWVMMNQRGRRAKGKAHSAKGRRNLRFAILGQRI